MQLTLHPLIEARDADDNAPMGPAADCFALVARRDLEADRSPIHCDDFGGRSNAQADRVAATWLTSRCVPRLW
jgi:hypothetical protein